jgi:hypothetical protein
MPGLIGYNHGATKMKISGLLIAAAALFLLNKNKNDTTSATTPLESHAEDLKQSGMSNLDVYNTLVDEYNATPNPVQPEVQGSSILASV